jgi:hypothetical protein
LVEKIVKVSAAKEIVLTEIHDETFRAEEVRQGLAQIGFPGGASEEVSDMHRCWVSRRRGQWPCLGRHDCKVWYRR